MSNVIEEKTNVSKEFLSTSKSLKKEVDEVKLKDRAKANIEKAEIPIAKKPEKNKLLPFPDDITEIPAKSLGKYLGVYEAQCGWISYCLARREIDLAHGHILLKFVYNKLLSNLKSDKITDKKVIVEADSFYLECGLEVAEIESDIKLLISSLETYRGYSKAISREISNRYADWDSFRRSDKVMGPKGGEVFGGEQ